MSCSHCEARERRQTERRTVHIGESEAWRQRLEGEFNTALRKATVDVLGEAWVNDTAADLSRIAVESVR